MPHLLPNHLLAQKHVLESFDAATELIYRACTEAWLHVPIVINAGDIEAYALCAGLSAIASGLLLATQLTGRDILIWLRCLLRFMTIRFGGTLAIVGFRRHLNYLNVVAYLPDDTMARIDEIRMLLGVQGGLR